MRLYGEFSPDSNVGGGRYGPVVANKPGPAGTSRPLRADARRNQELVLATAREMFAAEGLSVSFDEIARRAGVGVGTVYRHFPTRAALFEAVILGRIEQFVDTANALADAEDPGEAFVGFFAHVIDQVSLNQALCDALEVSGGAAFAAPATVQHDFLEAFGVLLGRAQQAGAIRPDLDIADINDLVVGCATAERRARHRGAPDRLVGVVCEGMRGARSAREPD